MDKYSLLRYVLYIFEIQAFITGVFCWRKVKHSYWKYLVFYLGMICLVELTGEFVGTVLQNYTLNKLIYTYCGIPLQFIFFCWLFYRWFKPDKEKKWPVFGAIIYISSVLFEAFYLTGNKLSFFSLSYLTGNIVLSSLVLFFLFKFIHSNEVSEFKKSMLFWVSLGLLSFYLGTLPFYGLWNTLVNYHPDVFNIYWTVQMFLNYLMYSFFSIAFVWGDPK